jgi:hypothetical protein
MTKTTIIVLIIYAIFHVVSWLVQKAAQRAEQQRQRDAMAGQTQAGVLAGNRGVSRGHSPIPRTSPAPVVISQRDDLATRRKAQLEQLRQRREQRKGPQPASIRVGTVMPPGGRQSQRPSPVERGPSMGGAEAARGARQELERRRRDAEQARRQWQSQQQVPPERAPAPPTKPQRKPAVRDDVSAGEIGAPRHAVTMGRPVDRRLVAKKLTDRKLMRELFVINELIQPPLALRSDGF